MLQNALEVFKDLGGILGIFMKSEDDHQQVVDDILTLLLEVRNSARQEKNYALADEVRNLFQKMQIKVEDKASGSVCRYDSAPDMGELLGNMIELRQNLKKQRDYGRADLLRDRLKQIGILIEDTKEGARWKFADA